MILLDTHTWIWWINGSEDLTDAHLEQIQRHPSDERLLSAISCWEIAKLVEYDRIELTVSIEEWMAEALRPLRRIDLLPEIAIASTQLPGAFHSDPADQIIVATARHLDVDLLTVDRRICDYDHVRTPEC